MTGPSRRAIARLVAATSSASDVSGFCTATAFSPAFSSSGITFAQLEPSAHAPCTRTTFRTLRALLSAAAEGCEVTAIVSAPTKINAERSNEPRIMCTPKGQSDARSSYVCTPDDLGRKSNNFGHNGGTWFVQGTLMRLGDNFRGTITWSTVWY